MSKAKSKGPGGDEAGEISSEDNDSLLLLDPEDQAIVEESPDDLLKALAEEYESDKKQRSQSKHSERSYSEDGIVFVGPSKAEQRKLNKEVADPLVDMAGHPKWIPIRECWCPYNAQTDCRFHSPREKGWEECPSKFMKTAGARLATPRTLWGINPLYGKADPEPEEVVEEVRKQA